VSANRRYRPPLPVWLRILPRLNQHLVPDVYSTGVWMRKSSWGAPRQAGPRGPDGPEEMAITGCDVAGGLRVLAEPHRRDLPGGGVPWQM